LLNHAQNGLYVVFTAAAAFGFYKYVNRSKFNPTSYPDELKGKPPSGASSGNPWDKNDGFVHFGTASASPGDIISQRINRNMIEVELIFGDGSGTVSRTHLMGVTGQYAVGVWHTLRHFTDKRNSLRVIRYRDDSNMSVHKIHVMYGSETLCKQIGPDLGLIKLVDINCFKNLINMIPVKAHYAGSAATVSGKNYYCHQNPPFLPVEVEFTGVYQDIKYNDPIKGNYVSPGFVGKFSDPFSGHCGSPLVSIIGDQKMINGIACASSFEKSLACFHLLDQNMINVGIKHISGTHGVFSPSSSVGFDDNKDMVPFVRDITAGNSYNHTWWLDPAAIGSINFRGNFSTAFTRKAVSKVKFLPHKEELFKLFPPEYHHNLIAPVFTHIRNDDQYISLERNALNDMSTQVTGIDVGQLDMAIEDLVSKFSAIEDFSMDDILDDYSCINGSAFTDLVSSMPKSTSAGFPEGGKKYNHLVSAPSEQAPHGLDLDVESRVRLDDMINTAATGERNGVIFKTCAKDEPRDAEKVAQRKIRLFTLGPMCFFILCKKYYGVWMSIYSKNFLETETVGGVNPFSIDWGRVYKRLSRFDRIINGDFSKFDKKSSTLMIMAAATVIIKVKKAILAKKGVVMPDSYYNSLISVASDIANPLIMMDKDLLELPGSLSSGILMTFLFNDIINSLYIRMAYYKLASVTGVPSVQLKKHFSDNVEFFSLGDDNTYSVSTDSLKFFNFRTVKEYFGSIGLKYTNADKSDDIYGSMPITSASIGKRKWVYDSGYEIFKCPIEKASILKTITICVASKSLTAVEQQFESLKSAVPELAQYSEEEYLKRVESLRSVFPEYKFPSYDYILTNQKGSGITPWVPESQSIYDFEFSAASLSCDDCLD
jgi:hypothetical protein